MSCVEARDLQADITAPWTRLEQLVPLEGRKFYGEIDLYRPIAG